MVESHRNIADDPLHSLLVLRRRSLQELTDVANGVCQVCPCVDEAAKAPHNMLLRRQGEIRRPTLFLPFKRDEVTP